MFMNQGILEVVKKRMARVNTDILGISELKWMGMGKFNSDDHISTTVDKNPLEVMRVALIVNKRVQMQHLGAI